MDTLVFLAIAQLNLIFGVAGLIWPDKVMPMHRVFAFPFRASYQTVRIHGIVSIGGYLLVLAKVAASAIMS